MLKISLTLKAAFLLALSFSGQIRGETDFDEVGRAISFMMGDSHFQPLKDDKVLNRRILDLYLHTLDPDRLYFTKPDIDGFVRRYTVNPETSFDILLLRRKGTEPARQIYDRFATRVAQRTDYIEQFTDKAAFNFDDNKIVALNRKKAPWPIDMFDAQGIWSLRIQHEILSEELLHEELETPHPEEPDDELQEEEQSIQKIPPRPKRDSPRKIVKARYQRFEETVLSASKEEILDYFFSAVAQAQDPHSDYLSVKENKRFVRELKNQLTGIGAELASQPDGSTRVTGLIVNGPAHQQGVLQPNDRIVAIDSLNNGQITDITYSPIERVVGLILGRKNTTVRLIIQNQQPNDNERRPVVIRRNTINLKNAAASAEVVKIAQPQGPPKALGWITIPSFYLDFEDGDPSVYQDVKRLVTRLKKENVDGIALDLRNNGGGSLTEVPKLAGLFLPRGPVVQAVNQKGDVEVINSSPIRPQYSGPLVVITDHNSASSSEILVGALQDYNRAIVVGETSTFGKGTVQEKSGIANFLRFMHDPERAGDLKTTVQKFYRVTGSSTQLKGVTPHIIIPSLNDGIEIGERYLTHALLHDSIRPAKQFTSLPFRDLFLPVVAEKSRQRVQTSLDFKYIREDLIKLEAKRPKDFVTLNRQQRLGELASEKQETIRRNTERRSRFDDLEWWDNQRFHFLRLSLEDLERPVLVTVNRQRDSNAVILRAPITNDDLTTIPEWPSGIDPVKREALAILEDMVQAQQEDLELRELKRAVQEAQFP